MKAENKKEESGRQHADRSPLSYKRKRRFISTFRDFSTML